MAKQIALNRDTLFLILAVALLAAGCLLIYFQLSANRVLREEAVFEQQQIALAQAQLARYRQLRQNAPAFRRQLEDLRRLIPGAPGEEALIRAVYYLADDAGLRVTEIRFDSRVEAEMYTQMPLVLTLEGGYQGLLQTLHSLRAGDRAIRVDELRVSGRPDGAAGVQIILSANAFYRMPGP